MDMSKHNKKIKIVRPANFPLRLPDDLKDRLKKMAGKHSQTITNILIAAAYDKVIQLEKSESVL
jgi:predicted transcriptional regulator